MIKINFGTSSSPLRRARFGRGALPAEELLAGPIRGELLGAERLAERARAIAAGQTLRPVDAGARRTPLLARLVDTRRILAAARARLGEAARQERDIGPAGEWLLDNFYVVAEHIREVHESLPRSYYGELRELAAGPLAGYPRVYEIAVTLISHTEGRIDRGNVDLFVDAFQAVSPLTIGELWAVPAMLRLGLIESVRRMALRTVQRLDQVEEADRWAARLQEAASAPPGAAELGPVLNAFVADHPPLTPIFVTRFLHQLRLGDSGFLPLAWLEQWVAEDGVSAEDAAARSSERLALTQVMTANSITSLRAIGRLDWKTFVERQSVMETVLCGDPAEIYARMTFATRDHYRHVVERVARRTQRTEQDVAERAVSLAEEGGRASPDDPARGHVGYYLVDDGRAALERATGYRPTRREAIHRWVLRHPNLIFVGGMLAGTLAALAALLWLGGPAARASWWVILGIALLALLPANEIAISVVNQLVTAFLPPRTLPKLDLRQGIPSEFRTAVVIPTLFGSVDAVREALDNLEVQFLANREAHLHFAVLSDFTDADTETCAGDAAVLAEAVDGVRALNARYSDGRDDAFYLFHRNRRWNEPQGTWMGWERKRGKLAEFNRFLRGAAGDAFSTVVGDPARLRGVRYVITLDADTVLPPDAAPLLVGALAHPLNRAVYDPALGRVTRGYGILQPRVGVSLPSAHRSRFAAIHSGHPGVDPYTTAVSDVYQDLYGEGSFTGKGIYDVDAFERATHGRFPENTLLSHDLIEGSYARAGLATDVEVYDDYPTRYLTYTRRKHRWIRGDWQLLRWLTSRVPGPEGTESNRLSLLSRWKLFDNLRRSLVEISQVVFLIAGWTVLPGSPLRWTALGLLAIAAPWIVSLLLAALRPPLDRSWRAYYAAVARDAGSSARQLAVAITFLPHQAWVSADAIVRTLWRVFVSKRSLLEWQTASQSEHTTSGAASDVWRTMWPAVALSLASLLLVAAAALWREADSFGGWPMALAVLPLIALWLASPAIAHALSEPATRRERRLSPASRAAAMRYALLHWRFFDRFVTADTRWLAPDNFQEDPEPVLAMRTSPTNIGLQLLSIVSAYDLGFLSAARMAERLELTFRSLEGMRRFRGHFYNWYDLHDLRVLEPAYISTVDSGNLAGHLLALRQACLAIVHEPVFDGRVWRALETAIDLAREPLVALAARAPGAPRVIASANAQLQLARATVRDAALDADPAASLDAVDAAVTAALAMLQDASIPAARLASATEWLTWIMGLIAEHRASPSAVAAHAAPGRDGEVTIAFPTVDLLTAQSPAAAALAQRLEALADRAGAYAAEMDFGFLFDRERELFAIGYQETSHTLDSSFYDLLASEARLASFVAIARKDVPVDHWFRLGRTLTRESGAPALVSWSGSMFEYLMPALVMRSFPFTVLDQTYESAVRRQMSYGAERGVPWGVSESAYNLRDRHFTYQYRAFGVPDLALKRGLGRDLVIAPYASALTTLVDPVRALANLAELERLGALGAHGFYDALDYTRPDPGERYAVVHNYMAHHIGMSLVAFTDALTADIWQRRFHADPLVRSAELLLHERIPRRLVFQSAQPAPADEALPDPDLERPAVREIDTPATPAPRVALLGHLPYTLMVTNSGAGYSRYEKLAVTRWRADATGDNSGQFCYVKDVERGRVWSVAHQPTCASADWYRVFFATDRVTFHRADGELETRTEIAVVPADAAEVRRVTVTNNGREPRVIELTSYGEVVLAPPDADRAHPAFANLFVETEWHEWCSAITATRRPRSATESSVWAVHVAAVDATVASEVTCETDRARFLGRGRSTHSPAALDDAADGPLSGTTGAVLDPIIALRARLTLAPGQSASVAFTTLVAPTRELAFSLADRYNDPSAAQRALDLAWTAAQIELRELNITPADAALFQELAGHLFFGDSALRAPAAELVGNQGGQPLLWSAGLSGDWPILLATIDSADGLPTLRQLLAAHQYWRRRGMLVDLVVLNTHPPTYLQDMHDRIATAIYASSEAGVIDQPGGVAIRRADLLEPDTLLMLRATARVHVACDGRSLGRVMQASESSVEIDMHEPDVEITPLRSSGRSTPPSVRRLHVVPATPNDDPEVRGDVAHSGIPTNTPHQAPHTPDTRLLDNGLGGLTPEGDYEIRLQGGALPPAPWANVVANPRAGFVVTERGAGFAWAENSYFFRLTPWFNDPVSDPTGEVFYLRDDSSGELWSATPAPIDHSTPYTVRHGAATSTFEHEHAEIATHLTLGITEHDPVKLSVLRVTNRSAHPRRLTITSYVEWTLGAQREHTRHQVQTSFDSARGAIIARNFFDPQFADQVAFCALSEPVTAHTGDRREFLGRNGSLSAPLALRRSVPLSGSTGAGLDPCAALQCVLELAPGETREIALMLGAAPGDAEVHRLLDAYRSASAAQAAIDETVAAWGARLSVVQVRTPDAAFDAMVNRWSLYQALASRMWARSALYQSSGAYGFRDQLQDTMAFVYAEPGVAREHILRASARQFLEGDVQHWWHPQSGRGVRTRFSDDLAWLPFVVDHYVRVTGDATVLDEYVPFLTMRQLAPHEHELYDLPQVTDEHASVYEHCLRALRKACTAGAHGLPLIGIGDWNDGMNRVGVEGRGESVWLAWFLTATLRAFAPYADARGDHEVAAAFRAQADAYVAAVEANGWDGEWYRRAYFDDGTPLGSSTSDECRIDAIAQSWSVISGAGEPTRQAQAMRSFETHLVRDDARILLLLAPPFDQTPHDPGYIKGYLPGVRENGAQYTHAALWSVLATAIAGDGDRAFELFQMINPLMHARTPDEVATYKVEPYVVAADVYAAEGQLGRGGWTWYTGSASWLYRVALETLLGFTKRGDTLVIEPRVPRSWPGFSIDYRYGRTLYRITVDHLAGSTADASEVLLDGTALGIPVIPLVDDGGTHQVVVRTRR